MQPAQSHPVHAKGEADRRHERTHLFLAASLCSKAGSGPVHVRNISASGALIEGSIAPADGEPVILKRGRLAAAASMIWKEGRRAGIAFGSPIDVADWMARQPSTHQARVDEMVRAVRSESAVTAIQGTAKEAALPVSWETELRALRNTLEQLESGLVADVIMVATHPEIQLLDAALQSIDRIFGFRKTT